MMAKGAAKGTAKSGGGNDTPRDWLCSEALMAYTLGATLVMWYPSFMALYNGSLAFSTAMFRLALAMVIALIGVRVVARLVDTYMARNHRAEVAVTIERHRRQMAERQERARLARENSLDRELEADE